MIKFLAALCVAFFLSSATMAAPPQCQPLAAALEWHKQHKHKVIAAGVSDGGYMVMVMVDKDGNYFVLGTDGDTNKACLFDRGKKWETYKPVFGDPA